MGWPCPFASLPMAIENSTWSEKSASDELSGKDTKQLSTYAPVEYCKKHYKAMRLTAVKTMFTIYTHDLPCYF